MSTHTFVKVITVHRAQLACIVLWLLAASPTGAQSPTLTGVQIETGLLSFFTGGQRVVRVTVTEVAMRAAESQVRIIYRDVSGRVVARDEGILRRTTPVTFALPLDMGEPLVQLRASITIVGPSGRRSAPVVVLEDIDPGSFAIEERVSCAPPASREGPVTPYCPEVVVTSITTGG